jgi:hypothetical protein
MDEIRGCFHIKNLFRADKVARIQAGCACKLPLRHDYVVELSSGEQVCADRYRWVDQPDPDERYGDWV